MLIKAEQKYIRISPRKVKPIAQMVSNLPPSQAIEALKFSSQKGSRLLLKVLKQAVANAVNNKKLKEENLKIASILVGKGPILKRWRPISRGRPHSIAKRTCHIKVILEVLSDKVTK